MENTPNVATGEEPKSEAVTRKPKQYEPRVEEEIDLFPFGANPGITFGRE